METSPDDDASDEFFDCMPEVRYCAIASPRGRGLGEVFLDFKKAQTKWKEIKGSRMKFFDSFNMAKMFADTPVDDNLYTKLYAPSPKADTESTSFPNVPQPSLHKFRTYIEKSELEEIRKAVDQNPMHLVTSSDTPTLLQIRLRYNALHVAAAAGTTETLGVILGFLNVLSFWKRIYPNSDDRMAQQRQLHVIDLYLNSPELGNLETPLHFASKFGHAACVRLLVTHPLIQLSSANRAGQTPLDVAATRVTAKAKQKTAPPGVDQPDPVVLSAIHRALDENYVILANVVRATVSDDQVCILPPVTLQQLQQLLAQLVPTHPSGLKTVLPFLDFEMYRLQSSMESGSRISEVGVDLANYGSVGLLRSVRAFAGPMLTSEAKAYHAEWTKANANSSCREFASIRLTDPVKGYERQGRYFARLFGTQWYESWEFLPDFLDLACESGLEVLEQFLKRNTLDFGLDHTVPDTEKHCKNNTNAKSTPYCLFDADETFPSTPILRRRAFSVETSYSTENNHIWQRYRDPAVLDDSLCDCSDSSDKQSSISGPASSNSSSADEPEPSSLLSPLVGLLKKLTFSSPLRWILTDSLTMGEPLCSQESLMPPHKRPAKVRTTSMLSSPGKRRHSKVDGNQPAPVLNDQPSPKKATTHRSHNNQPSYVHVLPLARHICRALPGGDPEMDTAVAILHRSANNSRATPNRSDHPWPNCLRSPSLIKFPTVAAWKRHIESLLHFSTNQKPL